MRSKYLAFIALLAIDWVLLICPTAAQQRLLVVGGGDRPKEGLERFVKWAGGPKARILIITWASGVPEESFQSINREFNALGPASVEHAPVAPLDPAERAELIGKMKTATAVFFSGGDQNRIMDVLADEELWKLFRERYGSGMPVGGTSAGAAALSDPMMTGEADLKLLDGSKVGVRRGIGLLPGAIFDQHFLVRQRHNRLFGFVLIHPKMLGIGIDEDTAVLIEDNRQLESAGASKVLVVESNDRGDTLKIFVLKPHDKFDLLKRRIEH
ncbi:MAG: cyanophycinase [Acidobacteriota bacterium]